MFTAPPILLIPVFGILSDHYGRKLILTIGLALFVISGAAITLTTDFRVVLVLRFIQGIGLAGISPNIITSIGDLFEGNEETTAQGFRFTVSGVTYIIFPLFAGFLILFDWQFPFLVHLLALPIALLVYLWFDEPTEFVRSQARIKGGQELDTSQIRALLRLALHWRVFSILIARMAPVVMWIGFFTYNFLITVQLLDGTPQQAGLLVSIGGLVWAVSASQAGRISGFLNSRFTLLVSANICLGLDTSLQCLPRRSL